MTLSKFKRYTFLTLGILVLLTTLYASIRSGFALGYAANISNGWKISLSVFISLIISVVLVIVVALIEAWLSGDTKKHSFIVGSVSLFVQRNHKFVCHNELGYFFIAFEGDQICVHTQGFFIQKELFSINNTGDVITIARSIKQSLDKMYSTKVKEEKSEKEKSDRIDAMKKWDGYLDTQGRRDGKIKEILK